MYVCLCKGLKQSDVQRAALEGNTSPESLIASLGLRDPVCCGRCAREISAIVRIASSTPRQPAGQTGTIAFGAR